jgi:hypothetical protein
MKLTAISFGKWGNGGSKLRPSPPEAQVHLKSRRQSSSSLSTG